LTVRVRPSLFFFLDMFIVLICDIPSVRCLFVKYCGKIAAVSSTVA